MHRSRIAKSTESKHSRIPNSSSELALIHAKAGAATVKLKSLQQEMAVLKQQAAITGEGEISQAATLRQKKELEAGLKLLNAIQKPNMTKIEVKALENEVVNVEPRSRHLDKLDEMKPMEPMEHTTQYLNEQLAFNVNEKTKPSIEFNLDAPPFIPKQPHILWIFSPYR